MADRRERELLLGIFLMEAWDTAGALEEGLGLLTGAEAPSPESLSPLAVFAHRLKGSAGLHGFPGVADLAAATERLLERMPHATAEERTRTAAFLDGLVSLLKDVFDGISAVGVEDGARIAEFKSRYPAFLSSASASSSPTVAPAAVAPTASPASSLLAADLSRFFLESGEVLEYFLPEATEHLDTLTTSLLALEGGARDEETLATIFRAAHTLKGAAYTVGCAPIGDATHHIEDLLGAVRARRIPVTPAITEAVFAGTSAIKRVLQAGPAISEEIARALDRATLELQALLASEAAREPEARAVGEEPVAPPAFVLEQAVEAPRILEPSPAPAPAIEAVPGFVRPEFLARLEALPRPVPRAASPPSGPSIRVAIERLDTLLNLVGELMIARSRLDRRLGQLDQVGELLAASRTRLGQTGRDFEFRRHLPPLPGRKPGSGRDRDGDLRDLSDLFAELEFDHYDDVNVLARSVTEMSADVAEVQSQHVTLLRSIREDSAHIQRLTAALRKEITRARMVPIGRLFTRVAQQVREVARAADKTVGLTVRGEAAEVDNSIIEQIADPLLHLIQNAIVHGIESPADRARSGKPGQGQITLSASQEGGFILVVVEDDGRGIDTELVRRLAVERGLISAADAVALAERDALNLIFVPGFSTASAVTRASGRGVGLDVARTNVSRLNGEIHVETEPGRLTRFVLKLPLTVAIADALMVRCGSELFAFPLTAVTAMRSVDAHELVSDGGRETARFDDQVLELVRLDRALGLPGSTPPSRLPVVVLRGGGRPFGVVVDELLGKEEIVIKSLGAFLEGVGPFSGATISGEGRVILLLDPTLLRQVAAETPAGSSVAPPRPTEADEKRPRVMLVDDSVSIRKFVGQMLDKAGFQVVTAVDGQDALELLLDRSVDVIVTDLEMPRVNGYALIEDLRRRSTTREVPVIVLTSRAGDKHVQLARRLGVRHYVAKPVDEQSFVQLVRSVVTIAEPALVGAHEAQE